MAGVSVAPTSIRIFWSAKFASMSERELVSVSFTVKVSFSLSGLKKFLKSSMVCDIWLMTFMASAVLAARNSLVKVPMS